MLYTTALLVYDEPSYIQWYKHYHVTAVKGVLRAGSHYRRFCRTLITLGIKICQHTSFLMRPLTCNFLKISISGKNIKDAGVLGWADQFFQISKKQRSPPPKLSTVEKNDSQYRRQGHERGKEHEISLLRSSNAEKWAVFLPSGPGQHSQFGLLWAPNKEKLSHCYTVRPHGKCRGWTQFHRSNFLSVIDACIFTLNLFHFRSDTNWFCSQFFQAKIKIGLLCDPAPTDRIQLSYLSKQEQTLQEHSQDLSIC